jgi:Arc/MetJ family transcription regulator
MRTNIELDDKLIKEAKKLSGIKTKKEIVNNALEKYVRLLNRKRLIGLFGRVRWEGSLESWRKTRTF